jgi:NMD protein affecting ribosome stability and mRNA decay
MRCETLLHLLNIDGWGNGKASASRSALSAHIHTCLLCQEKVAQLVEALAMRSTLTCDLCARRLPEYYEATRPEYPLVELSEVEMLEVFVHLDGCSSCRDIYDELVLLSELEERDEMIEP